MGVSGHLHSLQLGCTTVFSEGLWFPVYIRKVCNLGWRYCVVMQWLLLIMVLFHGLQELSTSVLVFSKNLRTNSSISSVNLIYPEWSLFKMFFIRQLQFSVTLQSSWTELLIPFLVILLQRIDSCLYLSKHSLPKTKLKILKTKHHQCHTSPTPLPQKPHQQKVLGCLLKFLFFSIISVNGSK